MKTWQVIYNAIRFQPLFWLGNAIAVVVITMSHQAPPLVLREFFNDITGDAPAQFDFWTLIAFFAAAGLVRIVGNIAIVLSSVPFFVTIASWLERNMFQRILERPGASALPNSSGEAISRFRGDVDQIIFFPLWINDFIGSLAYSVVALTIMIGIDPYITGIACVPVVLVVVLTSALSRRIADYRRRSSSSSAKNSISWGHRRSCPISKRKTSTCWKHSACEA